MDIHWPHVYNVENCIMHFMQNPVFSYKCNNLFYCMHIHFNIDTIPIRISLNSFKIEQIR
jgi:hypothetical protein